MAAEACDHLMGRFVDIIERGRQAGALREDLVVEDIGPILWSNARIVEASGTMTPDAWRRHLGFVLDGLRKPRHPPASEPTSDRSPGREANPAALGLP